MLHSDRDDVTLRFVSVNISVRDFNSNWVELVRSSINEFSIPPQCIHLEITESIFLGDIEENIYFLNQLVNIAK
jgi:EAL domain-containing protein (putative c-di-GMP-specific phosphodiesterase class I)